MVRVEVAFDRSSLWRLSATAALMIVAGAAMTVTEYILFGVEVPPWLRVTFGVLAVLMGGWFAYASLQRARSDDPAIRVAEDGILFHVNPGRRVFLTSDEIRRVGPVEPVARAPARVILGDRSFGVATTRPEGLRASSIVVGSRFVAEDIEAVRDRLATALR